VEIPTRDDIEKKQECEFFPLKEAGRVLVMLLCPVLEPDHLLQSETSPIVSLSI
jgi:hypothetical protein